MALPLGRWMTAATGAGIALFGVFQWYRAASRNKTERVDLTHTRLRGVIIALGAFGFLARGVVFGLIGAFLIDAARRHNTTNATGIAGALSALRRQEYGHWLLGAVAAGLICYGLFQILKEPYRKFRTS
jgi:sugar phosphate permease